jgi:predicted transcriptional regulator
MIKNEFSVEEISKTLKSSRGQIYYDIRKIKTKDMEEKNGNTKRR